MLGPAFDWLAVEATFITVPVLSAGIIDEGLLLWDCTRIQIISHEQFLYIDILDDFGKDFGKDFGNGFGEHFGKDFGEDFGKGFGEDYSPFETLPELSIS